MKTILTFAALMVPLMALAAPAEKADSVRGTISVSRSDRNEPRRDDAWDRGNDNRYDRNDDRRDDRNAPRYDDRADHNDRRRPAPMPVARYDSIDRAIRAAYREVLEREPDAAGLRNYRERLLREGWTEDRMRAALRDSSEFRGPVVNAIITRAYRDILGRAPDAAGLENYRYKIIARGWSEEGLRNTLIDSAEYRNRLVMLAANDARGNPAGGPRNDGRRLR